MSNSNFTGAIISSRDIRDFKRKIDEDILPSVFSLKPLPIKD